MFGRNWTASGQLGKTATIGLPSPAKARNAKSLFRGSSRGGVISDKAPWLDFERRGDPP